MKKSHVKNFNISKNKRAINILICVNFTSKKRVDHFSTLVCLFDTNLWSIVLYTSIKHQTHVQTITTRWRSLKLRSLYLHISKCDLNETW